MLGSRTTLQPLPHMGVDLGLGRVRMFPLQLLAQHRFPELEERQGGLEAFRDESRLFRTHRESLLCRATARVTKPVKYEAFLVLLRSERCTCGRF
jgi:hypothetical protein